MKAIQSENKTRHALNCQRGVALLLSLLLLLVLSVATIAAIQTGGLQERIAGNTRDRNTAFNAAESALRDAEDYMSTELNLPLFDGSVGGHYQMNTFPALTVTRVAANTQNDGSNPAIWSDPAGLTYLKTNGIAYGNKTSVATLPDVTTQPRYIIEQMTPDTNRAITYRITAVGLGPDSSVVVLQSYYTPPQKSIIN